MYYRLAQKPTQPPKGTAVCHLVGKNSQGMKVTIHLNQVHGTIPELPKYLHGIALKHRNTSLWHGA
jgi:hypothetical protein